LKAGERERLSRGSQERQPVNIRDLMLQAMMKVTRPGKAGRCPSNVLYDDCETREPRLKRRTSV
jgi:hypothetical protein